MALRKKSSYLRRDRTISQAIALAEGFTSTADKKTIEVTMAPGEIIVVPYKNSIELVLGEIAEALLFIGFRRVNQGTMRYFFLARPSTLAVNVGILPASFGSL